LYILQLPMAVRFAFEMPINRTLCAVLDFGATTSFAVILGTLRPIYIVQHILVNLSRTAWICRTTKIGLIHFVCCAAKHPVNMSDIVNTPLTRPYYLFFYYKLPHYTLAGFDLTTHGFNFLSGRQRPGHYSILLEQIWDLMFYI
jgi:hypothetical protein